MSDALLVAARSTLDDSLGELRKAIERLDADGLNTAPAGPDSNPVAVLVVHALASTRSWLALATGAPLPPRDRPREFETVVTDVPGFLASVDATADACRELLAGVDDLDPARTGTAPWRQGAEASEPVTAAWALLHALDHLREHVGHTQLTRQLLGDG
jgi:uncharacterized damage-inducible protein DinB